MHVEKSASPNLDLYLPASYHAGGSSKSPTNHKQEKRMKRIATLSAMAIMTAFAGASMAETVPMLQEGTKELTLQGDLDFDSGIGTTIDVDLGLGFFIRDGIEVGGRLGLNDNDYETNYRFGLFTEYNLASDSSLVPFVGAELGWFVYDPDVGAGDSENSFTASASAGAKYFIASNIAISLAYTFIWSDEELFTEDPGLSPKYSDTDHHVRLGMRFYF